VNLSPQSDSSDDGVGVGTPPDSPHTVPDGQEALVEAIQQQDALRAVQLAERYVHRYGMDALELLMQRADAHGADGEPVRSWLLPLLAKPSGAPLPSSLPSSDLPAPVALDEAFAPLEVAFPPRPTPVGDPHPNNVPPQTFPDPPTLSGPGFDEPFPLEELENRAAAPVPTFEVEGQSSGSLPPPRRSRKDDKRGHHSPAPISPALARWLVWLPGAFESRHRS